MNKLPLMQQVLGNQRTQLPAVLQKHYQHRDNTEVGVLNIEYPVFMQPYLSFLRLMGALINRRGKQIPTTVSKRMVGDIQYWHRSISFPNGRVVLFKSRWTYAGGNELIEYINPFVGLRMRVHVNTRLSVLPRPALYCKAGTHPAAHSRMAGVGTHHDRGKGTG